MIRPNTNKHRIPTISDISSPLEAILLITQNDILQQNRITSSMSTLLLHNIHNIRLVKHGIHNNLGRVGVILNRDTFAETVSITDVAIFMLSVKIQLLHTLVVIKLERKRVILCVFVVLVSLAEVLLSSFLSIFLSVETKITETVNEFRFSVEPEMHKIEVVDRLVHLDTTAGFLVTMPATHKVCAMCTIKDPVHVHSRYLSNNTRVDKLTDFGVVRSVAVVEENTDLLARLFLRVDHSLEFMLINSHWLFRNGITTKFHGADAVMVMEEINRCDDDNICFLLLDHLVELGVFVGLNLFTSQFNNVIICNVETCLVGIADAY
ncbi:hypothetical protein HG531_005876 [Fusarium graminearum]|nr:hypothetical protein HG531_005876 [Fusarium graminearum]